MDTSNKIRALFEQIHSGKMESDSAKILRAIIVSPKTLEYFVARNMKYSTVTARLSNLEDLGLIKKNIDPLNSYSIFSFIKEEENQITAREKIKEEKRQLFIKKGIEKGYIQTTEYGYYFFQGK